MASASKRANIEFLPVLFCRGTHFDVGLCIGKTFKSMIQELLQSWSYFNNVVVPAGTSAEGKRIIERSLQLCTEKFPGYVDEIRGMAEGAEIEFDKLFMLNIDSILCTLEPVNKLEETKKTGGTGCTTVLCNKDEVILGHTEDALTEIRDHVYIISAEILSADGKTTIEKFTTLCYAGTLMGYTMGFNYHGMIYSVNTIFPTVYSTGTPRSFLARAVLGASDLENLLDIVRDAGNGAADGFSVNVYFYPKNEDSSSTDTVPSFYNVEIAPPSENSRESVIDVQEVKPGSHYVHCNRYLRLESGEANEAALNSSDRRSNAASQLAEPTCQQCVKQILSDQRDFHYPIYNEAKTDNAEYEMSFIKTVAVGIFDIHKKTWSVYTRPPASGSPLHTFTLK